MKHCPFCDLKQRALKENKLAFVLLSDPRKVKGHFLVIPKRHVEKPWEVAENELVAIFELIFFVQKRISRELAQGCDVRQNYRPFLKQGRLKIDHVHFHVIPRSFEDELYTSVEKYETPLFKDLSPPEYDQMAKILEE